MVDYCNCLRCAKCEPAGGPCRREATEKVSNRCGPCRQEEEARILRSTLRRTLTFPGGLPPRL